MAVNFPTSLDSFTNPNASDATNAVSVPHATQHSNANDAIEALEARVGIVGSADAASLTYKLAAVEAFAITRGAWSAWTPVFTQGSAVAFANASKYAKVGRVVHCFGYGSFTAAGTGGSEITCTLPVTASGANGVGSFVFFDSGAALPELGGTCKLTGANEVKFVLSAASAGKFGTALTIASGDVLEFTITYESAA